jgi:diadenosine tetraphosphate (Ap4A) HIT family hydrolase
MKEEVVILETNFWKAILNENQSYLGRCIVVLKRSCGNMSDITTEEWLDFHENVLKKLESTFKKAFGATMFNWTCLMNFAYQEKIPKPQVHWHFKPRYDHEVEFAGENFQDLEFAHHYSLTREKIVSNDLLLKIAEEFKRY